MNCPYCGRRDCEHVVLHYEDWQQLDWRYTRAKLGVNIYGPDPAGYLQSAIIAALRTYCVIGPGVVYATEWGREGARREVTHVLRQHGFEVESGET